MTSTDTRSPGDGKPRPAPSGAAGSRTGGNLDSATTALRAHGPDSETTALPVQSRPPRPGPSQPGAADRPVSPLFRFLSPALALLAVALLPVAAATTDLDALDGWGLAKVLGPAGWAALTCAVAACVTELWSPRPRIPMLATATGVLILCSVGMPSVVQPAARFTTAWLLAGFTDALAGDGIAPTGRDARFYWPAFFAQWAFFRDAGGATQLDSVLRWFPPVIVAVWAIGIYALARSMLGGTRMPWAAVWLFLGLNWIEQDYFSPQATAIVLMLTVLTFALGPLATRRTDAAGIPGWPAPHAEAKQPPLWRRWLVAGMTPPNRPTLPPRQLLLIYFCAALCLLAIAPTHQLTPVALIGQLVVLAVVGRFRGRALVLVAILALAVYIIIAGRDFWLNQLSLLIGSGNDDGAIEAGVADRLMGDTGQVTVKTLRAGMSVVTYLLAIVGAWVYWHRRRDLVPLALALVPMGVIAQGYGGEVFLRVVLFGLPLLAILGADALRALVRRWRGMEYVLAAGMVLLFGSVILIRGGNDAYQVVFPDQVALARQVIAETPPGLEIVPLSHVGPYGVEGIDTHGGGNVIDGCSQLVNDAARCIDEESADVLITFTSVEKEGVYLDGKPPGWSLDLIQELVASGRYVLTYQDGFNAVLKKAVPDPAAATPGPATAPAPGAGG